MTPAERTTLTIHADNGTSMASNPVAFLLADLGVTKHHGNTDAVNAVRAEVVTAAYQRHLERFVRKHPEPAVLPTAAWIKPPGRDQQEHWLKDFRTNLRPKS